MRGLVQGDFLEVGVEGGVEAGVCEVRFGEVVDTRFVEVVFEVLEGEGVVEDVAVGDGWGISTDLLQVRAAVGALEGHSFIHENSTRFGDSRLGNRAGSSDGSECCNGECRLHGF